MVNKDKINIIITDDSSQFIEGLQLLLSKNQDYKLIDTCENGLELINNTNLYAADLLLIDIEMPVMSGLEAARRVNRSHPHLPMIAITMHQERVYLEEIVCAGFKAFIHKPEISKRLFDTIQQVLSKEFIFPDNLK